MNFEMKLPSGTVIVGATALAVIAIALVSLILWQLRGGEASELTLAGVSLDGLAEDGVVISEPPDDYVALTTSDAARAIVSVKFPNVDVKQVLLAHIKFDESDVDTEAWVVNLDPEDPDLNPLKAEGIPTFAVAFVDADSGEFIYAMGELEPPPGGFTLPEPADDSDLPLDGTN